MLTEGRVGNLQLSPSLTELIFFPATTSMLVLACGALSAIFVATSAVQPEVTTSLGTMKGLTLKTISGRSFHAFLGVPYAKPPVGELRFEEAIPSGPWTGIFNATRASDICIQEASVLSGTNATSGIIGSENCLYLNIFTPKLPSERADGKLMNVIVYIHGGAFQVGAGNVWGPLFLLDRDVILVTFNYRLGLMGFLSFGDTIVPGNNGLKDQLLVLQWVRNHAAAFGGDPNKVTIAGMSAGGSSAQYHMFSSRSKGLFHKAILTSGTALNPWALTKNARKESLLFAESVGCSKNNTTDSLKCLKEQSAQNLLENVHSKWYDLSSLSFIPVIEPAGPNAFIAQDPIDLIKSNNGSDVPALFAHCDDDGSQFALVNIVTEESLLALENNWNELLPRKLLFAESGKAKEIAQDIRKHFLGDKQIKDNLPGFCKIFGERYFFDGVQKAAMLQAEHQSSPVYSYRFSFKNPKGFNSLEAINAMFNYEGGSCHGNDNSFVFNSPYLKPIQDFPELLPMVKYMTDLWMTFIEETPAGNWSTVNSAHPKFTYLDIWSLDFSNNTFKTEDSFGRMFWDTLDLSP